MTQTSSFLFPSLLPYVSFSIYQHLSFLSLFCHVPLISSSFITLYFFTYFFYLYLAKLSMFLFTFYTVCNLHTRFIHRQCTIFFPKHAITLHDTMHLHTHRHHSQNTIHHPPHSPQPHHNDITPYTLLVPLSHVHLTTPSRNLITTTVHSSQPAYTQKSYYTLLITII